MKRQPWIVSAALAAGILALYLSGLSAVPFHPDESSWLYMSRDFAALAPGPASALDIEYRLLNAPLPKYLMGLSWWLSGFTAADLNPDWVWPQTWDENVAAGHLPAPALLWAGRLPGAVLSALAAALLFWIVYEARGLGAGLAAALLLGLNPLVLLHGRRAMAEGPLLFFSLLTVWGLVRLAQSARRPGPRALRLGLFALGAGGLIGLAVCSKQSAIALLPAGGAALILPCLRPSGATSLRPRLSLLLTLWLALGLASGLTVLVLNPILYRDPVSGVEAMMAARADLARLQTETQAAVLPGSVTPDAVSRLRAALMEVYLRPPAIWDLPVYSDQLSPQAAAYWAQPFGLTRGSLVVGAFVAGLGVAGLAFSALRLGRDRLGRTTQAEQTLWWWALATLSLTLLATPFDWQRYFIPLVPVACVFAALGLEMLARPAVRFVLKRKA